MRKILLLLCLLICGCQDYGILGRSNGGLEDGDGFTGSDPGADAGRDAGTDAGPVECPEYAGALMDCAYQLVKNPGEDDCVRADCMWSTCSTEADCPLVDALGAGELCVAGNCVFCWHDSQCTGSRICRAGRCVDPQDCRATSDCTADRCRTVTASEIPCPVCVCDSIFSMACTTDDDCLPISMHPYRHCVYGRCAECRSDDECDWGACLPPGMCSGVWPHPAVLYGTWLIGWSGGLDHYSYFRFEPDGTLRRGSYPAQEPWSDDIPPFPCPLDQPPPRPYIGTWEPVLTASDFLVISMSLNTPCHPGAGWQTRYSVELDSEGNVTGLLHLDGDQDYNVWRIPTDSCTPDFSGCPIPDFPW